MRDAVALAARWATRRHEARIIDEIEAAARADCERRWGHHALAVHRLYYNVGVYRRVFEPWIDEVADRAAFTFDRLAPGRFLYGSGADIRADVEDWASRTRAEWMVVRMRHPGGPSHEKTLDAIRRFGDEVITKCA